YRLAHEHDRVLQPVDQRVPARHQAVEEVVGAVAAGTVVRGGDRDGEGGQRDLVVEAALLGGEAVELALAAAERLFGVDQVGRAARGGDQRAQPVDRGPQRIDAGVEILPLHGHVVAVGTHPGD